MRQPIYRLYETVDRDYMNSYETVDIYYMNLYDISPSLLWIWIHAVFPASPWLNPYNGEIMDGITAVLRLGTSVGPFCTTDLQVINAE